jgi:hypothetical protein
VKQFAYFEQQEGGMGFYVVSEPDELSFLRGWMLDKWGCASEDTALVEWMQTAEIGDYYDHRLGVIVRLKDA